MPVSRLSVLKARSPPLKGLLKALVLGEAPLAL
jgi:hypothetical protein